MWWKLLWWIIVTALTDLLTKAPPDATPAGIGDFNIPTATEGRVVPIILGHKMKVNAPNCIWYGDYAAVERTQETGVIIKKESVIGYTYELALAYALCSQEIYGITGVWIGDEPVYQGPAVSVVDIVEDDIFGGKDQGGGFIGRLRLFNGAPDQAASSFMASRITEGLSAYRGTAYIMVTDIAETKGAEIGESPNLRYLTVEVQAMSTTAQTGLGDFLGLANDQHIIGDDANPATLAYGLLTDPSWGRGLPLSDVDAPSFTAANATCFTEGIGFSMLFDEFTSTEQIQDYLEQHMDCYIGPNAQTGKFEIKLARPNYVLGDEFQATDANIISIPTWNKGDWSQTFNRIRMRYTDRNKDWNETHAVANAPANRIIQGVLKANEVRYPGVHDATVANKIVAREKKGLSRPARSGTIELNRTAWDLRPGDVFSFTSTQVQETDLPVRITKVEIGDPVNNTLIVEVIEDIFDNEIPTVADPPDTDFVPPTQDVDPLLAADQWAIEAPYMIVRQDPFAPNVHPRLLTAARIATGAPTEYEIRHRLPGGSGSYVSIDFITGGFMQVGTLRNSEVGWLSGNGGKTLQVDPVSGSLDNLIGLYSPGLQNMQGVCVINPGAANEEWILCTEIVDDLTGVRLENVWRGALDTGMKTHSAGERIWFIWTGGVGLPSFQYAVGDTPDVKLLPRSPSDEVLEAAATEISLVPFLSGNSRYQRPLLPAQLGLNGTDFSTTGTFDFVFSVTGNPAEFVGLRLGPRLRDWRNQDPLDQVAGGGIRSDIWGDDQYQLEYWLYNLDTHPSPARGDAIVNQTVSAEFASDGALDILKDTVATQFTNAGVNSLPMRLEVEASHIPGASLPRMLSRDVIIHDFTGTGTFVIPFDATWIHLDFEYGSAGDRVIYDKSPNQHEFYIGNTEVTIDTASTPPLGTRAIRIGETNGQIFPNNSSSYFWTPTDTGDVSGALDLNQDFTIEWRIRFDQDPFADETILAQYGSGGVVAKEDIWRLMYMEDEDYWRFQYSTGGGFTGTINMAEAAAWFPVAGTWYAFMLTRHEQPDGSITMRLFRDGVKTSEINVAAFTINTDVANRPGLSIGAGNIWRPPGSGVTSDGMDGYLDEVRIIQGAALELVDYTLPVTSDGTGDYLIAMTNFEGEAGNDSTKLAEDLLSTDTAWVFDGTQAQCRIAGDKAKFGNTSLFVNGTQDAGLRWGNFETYDQMKHQYLLDHDFTIEGWVNFTALPSTTTQGMAMCGRGDNGGNEREYFFGIDENDEVEFSYWDHNAEAVEVNIKATTTPVLVADTWYHLAVCRNGTAIEAWIDGTRVLNDATFFEDVSNNPVTLNAGELNQTGGGAICVGKAFRDESGDLHRSMNGHVDSFRAIKRGALYTGASITVPTGPFRPPKPRVSATVMQQSDVHFHSHFNGEDANYDPAWGDVVSLLEFEGTDLDTTTTDDGQLGATWTFAGNAQIDNAQAAIGSTSLLLDGTGDYLTTPDNAAWEPAAEDFCIECFVRFNGDPGTAQMTFISKWESVSASDRSWWFGLNNNQLEFLYSTNGIGSSVFNEAWNPADATWYHVAVSRKDGSIQFFVDGLALANGVADTQTISNEPSVVAIGAYNTASGAAGLMNGWIDQCRVTIGEGRYADIYDFVVPTAARSQKRGYEFPMDHSDNGWIGLVRGGDPLIDTAVKKFGTASLYLDGASYVTLNDSGPPLDDDC